MNLCIVMTNEQGLSVSMPDMLQKELLECVAAAVLRFAMDSGADVSNILERVANAKLVNDELTMPPYILQGGRG